MNLIKLYGVVNAVVMAIFGFCCSSVMLQQYKTASAESFLPVSILGLVMVSVVQFILTNHKVNKTAMKMGTTVVFMDAIAYISIDLYAAHTGDLQTRWLLNTVILSVTASITGNIWEGVKQKSGEGQKYQAFLNSSHSAGSAIGLLAALVCSMYFSYRIGTKQALLLQASVAWVNHAVLIYMLKKHDKE